MRRLAWSALAAILIVVVLGACGGDGGDEEPAPPPAPTQTTAADASVPATAIVTPSPSPTALPIPPTDNDPATRAELRVVHASPDLPPVNLYLDGAAIGRGFTLGQFHATPLYYAAGRYTLRVFPADSGPGQAEPLLDYALDLAPRDEVIALIVGPAAELQVSLYEDDLDPLPAGTSRVTVFNAIPRGPGISLQEANQTLARDVFFGVASEPIEIPDGQHTFEFMAGADRLAATDIRLSERFTYTFLVVGSQTDPEVTIIDMQARVNDVTRARFVHASPDLPAVDVYLNGELVARDLGYRSWEEWADFPSQMAELRLVPAGTVSAAPVYEGRLTLSPNRAVDVVLLDSAERLRVVQVEEDLSPTPTNGARLVFVHAAIGPIQMAIQTFGGPIPGVTPISFGTGSRPLAYSAGPDAFLFLDPNQPDSDSVDMLSEREWQAGWAYIVVVTGYPNTEPLVLATEVGTGQSVIAEEGVVTLEPPDLTQSVRIRLLNALPHLTPLDLEMDGEPIFQDVQRGTSTVYREFEIPPSSLVVRNSDTGSTLIDEAASFAGTRSLTLFVFQDENGPRFELAPDVPFNIPSGLAQLRVFNAAYNKPDLQLVREERSLLPPTLPPTLQGDATATPAGRIELSMSDPAPFGLPTAPQAVPAGTYDVQIIESQTAILVHTIRGATFESGASYDLVILPDASGLNVNTLLVAHGP